jgi:hypothetical protein
MQRVQVVSPSTLSTHTIHITIFVLLFYLVKLIISEPEFISYGGNAFLLR